MDLILQPDPDGPSDQVSTKAGALQICYIASSVAPNDSNNLKDDVTDAVECVLSVPDND